jgi:hypothetical protein
MLEEIDKDIKPIWDYPKSPEQSYWNEHQLTNQYLTSKKLISPLF